MLGNSLGTNLGTSRYIGCLAAESLSSLRRWWLHLICLVVHQQSVYGKKCSQQSHLLPGKHGASHANNGLDKRRLVVVVAMETSAVSSPRKEANFALKDTVPHCPGR